MALRVKSRYILKTKDIGVPSGHAISVSILLLFCTIKTMGEEERQMRCDVTWCDVMWRDVTWRDVMKKMGCSVTWCDGMGCSVTWYHEIGPISFRFYDSVVLNCPGMFVLQYRNTYVCEGVCAGDNPRVSEVKLTFRPSDRGGGARFHRVLFGCITQ